MHALLFEAESYFDDVTPNSVVNRFFRLRSCQWGQDEITGRRRRASHQLNCGGIVARRLSHSLTAQLPT